MVDIFKGTLFYHDNCILAGIRSIFKAVLFGYELFEGWRILLQEEDIEVQLKEGVLYLEQLTFLV